MTVNAVAESLIEGDLQCTYSILTYRNEPHGESDNAHEKIKAKITVLLKELVRKPGYIKDFVYTNRISNIRCTLLFNP